MENLYPLVWVTFIVCLFLVWYFSHRANHKERLLRIEKDIPDKQAERRQFRFRFPWLKVGIVTVGISVGLLMIAVLVKLNWLDEGGNALPIGILGVCGGISLIIAAYAGGDKKEV